MPRFDVIVTTDRTTETQAASPRQALDSALSTEVDDNTEIVRVLVLNEYGHIVAAYNQSTGTWPDTAED